jgi:toxin ParE1/3/4
MRFEFHPEALEEYEEAARFYAGCQTGLELRFIDCVESALRQASEAPTRWAVFEADVRRCLVRIFPFATLYLPYNRDRIPFNFDIGRQDCQ